MNKIIQFFKEATTELGKVTWPSRPTVIRLTLGVILVSAIFAVFIAIVDIGLEQGFEYILSFGANNQSTIQDNIQVNPGDIQFETTPVEE
ncbi:MAG: preprotein translocase subunit SecE [Patescibacteria group bacterium]|nr:preprotein translocase subunit SecE [Patescibacteria group bacterium]